MKKFWDKILDILPHVWGLLAVVGITSVFLIMVIFLVQCVISMIGVLL